jgi:hypothetical protein|tara:strand:- start:512 stop:943 length:432 start_codon:yes stop_codon:yes gene_type:complete
MVEMRNNPQQEKGTTPATITVSMVLEDLENGIDRTGIKVKYDLQAWEVKQMFDHPSLKGKKAKRVKKLSFNFIDDTNPDVLPGQVDLIEAIDEEMKGRQMMDAQDQIQEFGTSEQVSEIEHESVIRETIDLEDRADTYNEQDY